MHPLHGMVPRPMRCNHCLAALTHLHMIATHMIHRTHTHTPYPSMRFQASVPAPRMPTIHECQPALWTVGLDAVPLATPASERRSLRRALRGRSRLDAHYVTPQFHPDYKTERASTVTPQSQRHVPRIPGVLVRSLLCLLIRITSYSFIPTIYTATVEISFAECFTRRPWYDPDGFAHIVHLLTCILPHLWAAVPCYFVMATSWKTVRRVSWFIFKVATWCVLCCHTDNAHAPAAC